MENSHEQYSTVLCNTQVNFRIDPEFENEIPKIKEEEYKQLYNNILEAGEVYEPLAVWNGVLVDGHNRWNIILELKEKGIIIKYRTREINFDNNHAAKAWMWKQQRGRRNLTDEQQEYAIGKQLAEEKLAYGGDRKSRSKTDLEPRGKTAQKIADENGIGYGSVFRAERFAKGIDVLREVNQEAADKVLSGNTGATKADIRELATAEPDIVEAFAQAVNEDKKPERKPRKPKTEEEKRDLAEIEAIVRDMRDPTTTPEFTLDFLIEDIELNGQTYVELLDNTLKDREQLVTDENKPRIAAAITKVVENILKVRDSM